MKINILLLSASIALLSTNVVFAADDHEYPTQVGIPQAPTFNTYVEITKELSETKPSLQECYDLDNPVRIIKDIYVELDQCRS